MIVTCAEMKGAEERAFADGISAEALMEEAGAQIAAAITQFLPRPGKALIFFGKGHNGGDALIAARYLREAGWAIELRPAFPEKAWAELTRRKHAELGETRAQAARGGPLLVLDGLLGIGASGSLREPIRVAAREINRARDEENAVVCAVDLPSGLDGETGAADPDAVRADFTCAIGAAKVGLVADRAVNLIGRLVVLPLRELTARLPSNTGSVVATAGTLHTALPRRAFDTHKGDCGRVGIIAGSPGMSGAAVLAADACLHAGAGLVTLYASRQTLPLVAARVAPEVMVKAIDSLLEVLEARHDVLAIGPGLGAAQRAEILAVCARATQPMIIDADALNALATQREQLHKSAGPRLLTPHPGEMARLAPDLAKGERRAIVERFTAQFPVTLLFKGARTIVGEREQPLSYNSTGSPGMATGGMGDVLTGVLAALAGQKLALYDAARVGAWLCGRAAERALAAGESEESLSATHVIAQLGGAFRDLRAGVF